MELETNTDSERALASVQIVENVVNHGNADTLELATVLGWQVVVSKSENVKAGDRIVLCEIDSLLPGDAPWLPPAIVKKVGTQANQKYFRVKTVKLRGELSQGLILTGVAPEILSLDIGTNVTAQLGIEKYEPNVDGGGAGGGGGGVKRDNPFPFPSDVLDKTDEPRVQSSPKLLKAIQNQAFYTTVKHDGTSVSFLVHPKTQEFMVCSRNQFRPRPPVLSVDELEKKDNVYWKMAIENDIETKLRAYFPYYAIQGEICGPSIQKNLLGLKTATFHVFNIVDLRYRRPLGYDEMCAITDKMGLERVGFVEQGDAFGYTTIKELLVLAQGKYPKTNNEREGIVIRSKDRKISFKVINNNYLIKYDY